MFYIPLNVEAPTHPTLENLASQFLMSPTFVPCIITWWQQYFFFHCNSLMNYSENEVMNYTHFSFKTFRSEIRFITNPGLS